MSKSIPYPVLYRIPARFATTQANNKQGKPKTEDGRTEADFRKEIPGSFLFRHLSKTRSASVLRSGLFGRRRTRRRERIAKYSRKPQFFLAMRHSFRYRQSKGRSHLTSSFFIASVTRYSLPQQTCCGFGGGDRRRTGKPIATQRQDHFVNALQGKWDDAPETSAAPQNPGLFAP